MADKLAGGVKAGSASVSLPVLLRKTSDNTELTGKVAADVTASYWRQGGSRTAITASNLTNLTDAYSSGGWKEVDAANQPGLYRFDIPDAAFAAGAEWAIVSVKVSGAYAFHERFNLETKGAAENFAELSHTSYGLSKLVRSTTPTNTLDINAGGGAEIGSVQADAITAASLATDAVNEVRDAVRQGTLTEGYASDGSAPTLEQMLYMIWSALSEFSITGTTITCKKLDGTTTAMTFTLNDATNPSSRTRAG